MLTNGERNQAEGGVSAGEEPGGGCHRPRVLSPGDPQGPSSRVQSGKARPPAPSLRQDLLGQPAWGPDLTAGSEDCRSRPRRGTPGGTAHAAATAPKPRSRWDPRGPAPETGSAAVRGLLPGPRGTHMCSPSPRPGGPGGAPSAALRARAPPGGEGRSPDWTDGQGRSGGQQGALPAGGGTEAPSWGTEGHAAPRNTQEQSREGGRAERADTGVSGARGASLHPAWTRR